MMTSTDGHRPEMVTKGNTLAEFYNNFNADYNHPTAERRTPSEEAAFINTYVTKNSTNNGPRPDWLILNEISASQWQLNPGVPSLSEHRTWVIDTVTLLNDVYGYKVITYSPYETVGTANAASWQALAAKSYVAIESYQSGTEVWNHGTDYASRLAWAESKYQASKDTYLAAGVPESRIFLSEHFGDTAATYVDNNGVTQQTGWGRAGLASAADWDTVIQLRQDAIYNVGFDGFLAYSWGSNGMGISKDEQLQHEYYYRTRPVLPGQKPQWLSDNTFTVNGVTVPLSWNQKLNWLGDVPNAAGAEVNFWRTITASRTITLDGSKTAGTLLFDSPNSYTIAAGSGGSLILDNLSSAATLTSNQGSHTISAPVQLNSSLNAAINAATFTISGSISGSGGLTKSRAGTLALAATNTFGGATTVTGGALRITSDNNLGSAPSTFTSGKITLDGGTLQFGANMDINNNRGIALGPGGGTIDTQSFTNAAGYNATNGGFTGSGNLTKLGTGTFFAAATSGGFNASWKGKLILKQGTWKIVGTDGLPYNAPAADGLQPEQVTFDGGTLQIGAAISATNARRGMNVAAGGGAIDTLSNNFTWAGPLNGSVSTATLNKNGSGRLTLKSSSDVGTFSGTLSVNVGAVTLDGGSAMGDLASINLANTSGVSLTISGGKETIGSLSGGGASGGNVSLVTDLATGGNNKSTTFAGVISGAGGLTKTGTGTMNLTSTNAYTGSTTVQGGKLSLANRGLADAADVFLSLGSTLELNFSGAPDMIDSLVINGASQPTGTWGAVGSGAEHTSPLFSGTGLLQVMNYVFAGDYSSNDTVDSADYVTWRRDSGAAAIANRDPQNSGIIGQDDYVSWRARFGTTDPNGASGLADSAAIPEPGTLLLFVTSLCSLQRIAAVSFTSDSLLAPISAILFVSSARGRARCLPCSFRSRW